MDKILRVNMSNLRINTEETADKYQLLGGRALTGKILLDEVPADCDPLGPDNKLVLAPGLLGGTAAPSSGRLSVGAKSPLTGGIKEANAGGTAAGNLAKLGLKAVVIEGRPAKKGYYLLKISSAGAELLGADEVAGLGNYEASAKLREKYGAKMSLILAGPAGELGYPMASVAVTDREGVPARHAARGGLGSVLAAKGIKAVLIDEAEGAAVTMADKEAFRALCAQWSKELVGGRKVLTEFGTATMLKLMNEVGGLATRNFSSGSFDQADNLSGELLKETIVARGGNPSHACQNGCPIRCSNIYVDEDGQHVTSSLEFETLALTGSNLGLGDLDVVARIDRYCDDMGIDTIELGGAIGVAMEAGILSFGDAEGVFALLEQIRQGTVTGRVVAQGVATAGKVLGVSRIPAVRGQGLAAYDPRAMKGNGVTYATSPMGADHTAANCLPGRGGYRPETKVPLDTKSASGQVELSKDIQYLSTVLDSMGICTFVGAAWDTVEKTAQLLSHMFGRTITTDEVLSIGKETVKTELEFNRRAGVVQKNTLPDFFKLEPLSPSNEVFDVDEGELAGIFEELK